VPPVQVFGGSIGFAGLVPASVDCARMSSATPRRCIAGLGVVVPLVRYSAKDAAEALTIGNNVWDVAPYAGFTYTTPPLLAEGTEISARLYVNNYLTNPDTNHYTGRLLDLDFAVTEHFGRFQAGDTG
jgi:hypothetical protein